MGYANPAQISAGIHLRQWSRAFIFAETLTSKRVVFVNLDICMGTQIIKLEVRPSLMVVSRCQAAFFSFIFGPVSGEQPMQFLF